MLLGTIFNASSNNRTASPWSPRMRSISPLTEELRPSAGGGDDVVDQLVSLGGFRSAQQPRERHFRPRSARIEFDRLVQQGLGLGSIAQTRGHCTERLALEGRIPIARLYQVHEIGEFSLAE